MEDALLDSILLNFRVLSFNGGLVEDVWRKNAEIAAQGKKKVPFCAYNHKGDGSHELGNAKISMQHNISCYM